MIYYEYTTGSFSHDEKISGFENSTVEVTEEAYNEIINGAEIDNDKVKKNGKLTLNELK